MFIATITNASATQLSIRVLLSAIAATAIVLVFSSYLHRRYHFTKKGFFTLLSGIAISSMLGLLMVIAALAMATPSKSLTRREARLAISVCDQQLMIQPTLAFAESSGSSTQKMYPDGRVEFVGFAKDAKQFTLASILEANGGSLSASHITLPYPPQLEESLSKATDLAQFVRTTPTGLRYIEMQTGSACELFPSMVRAFVYRYERSIDKFVLYQLTQPEMYALPESTGRQADCIVLVYGDPKASLTQRCGDYPKRSQIVDGSIKPYDERGR